MFKQVAQWVFLNRKKEARYLVALAGATGTMWASSAAFRGAVTREVAMLPHWIQGLAGLLAFVIPLLRAAKQLDADQGAA